jgi:hypothetical protein
MPKFIVFDSKYTNEDVKKYVINYAASSVYANEIWSGGSGVFYNNTENIERIFKATQEAYGEFGEGLINHFVISFNDKSSRRITCIESDVWLISQVISDFIGIRFQNVFYVHNGSMDNKNNLHVHFVVNRVSYVDGHRFYVNRENFHEIIDYTRSNAHLLLGNESYNNLIWDNFISFEEHEWN